MVKLNNALLSVSMSQCVSGREGEGDKMKEREGGRREGRGGRKWKKDKGEEER